MPVIHDIISFYRGDQWVIDGFAADVNGNPIDLTNARVSWMLTDMDGNHLIDREYGSGVLLVDPPNGQFLIIVTSDVTATVPPGRCQDFCRTLDAVNASTTQWTGLVFVLDTPFVAPSPTQYGWANFNGVFDMDSSF